MHTRFEVKKRARKGDEALGTRKSQIVSTDITPAPVAGAVSAVM